MPSEPPRKGPSRFIQQFAVAMELPYLLVGLTLVGAFFGYLLDLWLKTAPAFVFVLGALGFGAGLRETLRRMKKMGNESKRNSKP